MPDISAYANWDDEVAITGEKIPPGRYLCQMVKSEMADVSNNGRALVCYFEIIAGEYRGHSFRDQFVLVSNNEKAPVIGRGRLKALQVVLGKTTGVRDSAQLHNIPCWADVVIEQDKNNVEKTYNKVKSYFQESAYKVETDDAAPF
jgi:hypothetical protein